MTGTINTFLFPVNLFFSRRLIDLRSHVHRRHWRSFNIKNDIRFHVEVSAQVRHKNHHRPTFAFSKRFTSCRRKKNEQRRGEHEIQLCHGQHISHQFSLTSERWTVEAQKEQHEDNEMANNKLNCIQNGKWRMEVGRIKGRTDKTNNNQVSHQKAQLIRLIRYFWK